MYIIIDTATGKVWKHKGSYPINLVESLILKGCNPVVISTHSDTIKYHHKTIVENGITEVIGSDEVNYITGVHTIFEN